jgi:hypothetical protein
MQIAWDGVIVNIDFVEGFVAGKKPGDCFFSVKVNISTSELSAKGQGIWYKFSDFEQFIRDLKLMADREVGNARIQLNVESSEDYNLDVDTLGMTLSMTPLYGIQCHITLAIPLPQQMIMVTFYIHRSKLDDLIANFESLNQIIADDLVRLIEAENQEKLDVD